MGAKSFVLNDESQLNSYGFRTLNEGIDLERFKANPVLLDSHNNSNQSVYGRWTNIRVEDGKLLADPEFDIDDPEAVKLKGKVDRGFIKGASMGIFFNHKNMELKPDGTYVLTKTELYEASVVAVPSNRNALKLYTEDGGLVSEEEVQLSISQLSKQNINMSKLTLSVAALSALNLQSDEDSAKVSSAILSLSTELDKEKSLRQELESKIEKEAKARALSLVEQAIQDGKITADKKEKFLKMAESDYALAADFLSEIPGKESLSGKVASTKSVEVKTIDDFEKLSFEDKMTFKTNHPDQYKQLFIKN